MLRNRLAWCPGRESNPHGSLDPRDFKSRASASFATRAIGYKPLTVSFPRPTAATDDVIATFLFRRPSIRGHRLLRKMRYSRLSCPSLVATRKQKGQREDGD